MKRIILIALLVLLLPGVGWADHSGTVTKANMKISATDTVAFIDFNNSETAKLVDHIGRFIVITDSAGKTLKGYIISAGDGEDLGSEMHTAANAASDPNSNEANATTDWGASGGVTFTSDGTSPNTGSYHLKAENASGQKAIYNTGFTGGGGLVKYTGNYKVTAGTGCTYSFEARTGDGATTLEDVTFDQTSYTAFTIYATGIHATQNVYFWMDAGTGCTWYLDNFSAKQVTGPSTTGVVIKQDASGNSAGWAVRTSGFNYEDSSGYSYTIYESRTIYVNPTCTYNGTGSLRGCAASAGAAGALNTLAGFYLSYGDTIYFATDTTAREQVSITGLSNVTLTSFGSGAKPIISGANLTTEGQWTVEGDIWYYSSATNEGIWVNGTLMVAAENKVDLTAGSNKKWFDDPNNRIYISPTVDPNTATTEITARAYAIYLSGAVPNTTLNGLHATKARDTNINQAPGTLAADLDNIIIKNCTSSYAGYGSSPVGQDGILMWGDATNSYWLTNILLQNNILTNNSNNGIEINGAHSGTITKNTCTTNGKCVELWKNNIDLVVSYNYSNGDTGRAFWLPNLATTSGDTSQTGIQFNYNKVVTAVNAFEIEEGTGHSLSNNTIIKSGNYYCFDLGTAGQETSFTLKNNLCYASASANVGLTVGTVTLTADNNLWYYSGGAIAFSVGGAAKTWAEWKALGYDAAGVNSDPLFTNYAGADYTLTASSPAVNTGAAVSGLTRDFANNNIPIGAKPEIGIYEYDPPAASTWYVTSAGAGSKNGTSWANAFEGFANVTGIAPGDTLCAGQSDTFSCTTNPCYYVPQGVTLDGDCDVSGTETKIDGSGVAGDNTTGIYVYDVSNTTVKRLEIYGWRHGIAEYAVTSRLTGNTFVYNKIHDNTQHGFVNTGSSVDIYCDGSTISYNTVYAIGEDTAASDVLLGAWTTNNTVSYNTLYGTETKGIDGVQGSTSGFGNIIEHNEIYSHSLLGEEDGIDWKYSDFSWRATSTRNSDYNIFRYNTIYDNGQQGITVNYDGDNCLIYGNEIYGNATGIWIAGRNSYETSNNYIYYNLVYDNTGAGMVVNETESGTINGAYVYHNVFSGNATAADSGGYGLLIDGTGIEVKNNIFYNNRPNVSTYRLQLYVATTADVDAVSENNIFYHPGAAAYIYCDSGYRTVAQSKSVCGINNTYYVADPLFTSSSDFHLQAGSPGINAGVNVCLGENNPLSGCVAPGEGIYADYDGNLIRGVPDIGAYEFIPNPIHHYSPRLGE